MSVRMRHTRGHTGNRRSHHALVGVKVVKDAASGNLRLPHHLDEKTGMYRGKQIFPPKTDRPSGGAKTTRGPSTTPEPKHTHEHAQEVHANAEVKGSKGVGKIGLASRPKARSGFGGGA